MALGVVAGTVFGAAGVLARTGGRFRTAAVAMPGAVWFAEATMHRQVAETRALLGEYLDLYRVHSVTPDSHALTDRALHRRLADQGAVVGLSTTGPAQAPTIRTALDIEVDGRPLFSSVRATWNLLEPSAGPVLAEAHAAGWAVIVKEAMANGRLAGRPAPGSAPDIVALAAALHQPWASIVLSGAATSTQPTRTCAPPNSSSPAKTCTV